MHKFMGMYGENGELIDLIEDESVAGIKKKLELTSILLPFVQNGFLFFFSTNSNFF